MQRCSLYCYWCVLFQVLNFIPRSRSSGSPQIYSGTLLYLWFGKRSGSWWKWTWPVLGMHFERFYLVGCIIRSREQKLMNQLLSSGNCKRICCESSHLTRCLVFLSPEQLNWSQEQGNEWEIWSLINFFPSDLWFNEYRWSCCFLCTHWLIIWDVRKAYHFLFIQQTPV